MSVSQTIRSIIKDAALHTGVYNQLLFTVYPYMYEPYQLVRLTEYLNSIQDVPGCVVEAGCAHGATTVFLTKFMHAAGMRRDYYAIDTFSGFVDEHSEYEIMNRGKPAHIREIFAENKQAWFDKSMALHNVKDVTSIACDVTKFDFAAIAPIAFCLLDVDLYQPIRHALPKIFGAMSPGGIIVVDDCQPANLWDGALRAYEEFVESKTLPKEVVAGKLGIIRV